MKITKRFLFVIMFFSFGINSIAQTQSSCEFIIKKNDSLLVLARDFAKQKQFITSDSYFKVAEENCLNNEICFPLGSSKFKEEHLLVIPAATYQKLIERVIELQDQNEFAEAMKLYSKAGIYFSSYNLGSLELIHYSIKDFVFSKGKGGFAKYLCEYYFDSKDYLATLEIYKGLLDRRYNAEEIKRPLYDLGVQLAMVEKKKQANANPQALADAITSSRKDLEYVRKGFLFAWKNL
jgi:hypothetical protein